MTTFLDFATVILAQRKEDGIRGHRSEVGADLRASRSPASCRGGRGIASTGDGTGTVKGFATFRGSTDNQCAERAVVAHVSRARACLSARRAPRVQRRCAMRAIDLTGRVFGRLTVLELAGSSPDGRRWRSRCECGGVAVSTTSNLVKGHTASCGCLGAERRRAATLTHGHAVRRQRTSEYRVWIDMGDRCRRPAHVSFPNYGGRGITVCPRWAASFEDFLADMGPKPTPQHSIDRIDADGHYEPGNCRWATREQQARNKRTSRFLEIDGVRDNLTVWAARSPASEATIIRRLAKGWSAKEAVFTPPSSQGRRS